MSKVRAPARVHRAAATHRPGTLNSAVYLPPRPRHLHLGLINKPPVTDQMSVLRYRPRYATSDRRFERKVLLERRRFQSETILGVFVVVAFVEDQVPSSDR